MKSEPMPILQPISLKERKYAPISLVMMAWLIVAWCKKKKSLSKEFQGREINASTVFFMISRFIRKYNSLSLSLSFSLSHNLLFFRLRRAIYLKKSPSVRFRKKTSSKRKKEEKTRDDDEQKNPRCIFLQLVKTVLDGWMYFLQLRKNARWEKSV